MTPKKLSTATRVRRVAHPGDLRWIETMHPKLSEMRRDPAAVAKTCRAAEEWLSRECSTLQACAAALRKWADAAAVELPESLLWIGGAVSDALQLGWLDAPRTSPTVRAVQAKTSPVNVQALASALATADLDVVDRSVEELSNADDVIACAAAYGVLWGRVGRRCAELGITSDDETLSRLGASLAVLEGVLAAASCASGAASAAIFTRPLPLAAEAAAQLARVFTVVPAGTVRAEYCRDGRRWWWGIVRTTCAAPLALLRRCGLVEFDASARSTTGRSDGALRQPRVPRRQAGTGSMPAIRSQADAAVRQIRGEVDAVGTGGQTEQMQLMRELLDRWTNPDVWNALTPDQQKMQAGALKAVWERVQASKIGR